MPVKIFVWPSDLSFLETGHVAIQVNNNYFSYWPNPGTGLIMWLNSIASGSTGPNSQFHAQHQDLGEYHRKPQSITLNSINSENLEEKINNFKSSLPTERPWWDLWASFQFLFLLNKKRHNCVTSSWFILKDNIKSTYFLNDDHEENYNAFIRQVFICDDTLFNPSRHIKVFFLSWLSVNFFGSRIKDFLGKDDLSAILAAHKVNYLKNIRLADLAGPFYGIIELSPEIGRLLYEKFRQSSEKRRYDVEKISGLFTLILCVISVAAILFAYETNKYIVKAYVQDSIYFTILFFSEVIQKITNLVNLALGIVYFFCKSAINPIISFFPESFRDKINTIISFITSTQNNIKFVTSPLIEQLRNKVHNVYHHKTFICLSSTYFSHILIGWSMKFMFGDDQYLAHRLLRKSITPLFFSGLIRSIHNGNNINKTDLSKIFFTIFTSELLLPALGHWLAIRFFQFPVTPDQMYVLAKGLQKKEKEIYSTNNQNTFWKKPLFLTAMTVAVGTGITYYCVNKFCS